MKKPISPTLFVKKAFLLAFAADSFSNQWPIKRYELTPTSSQNIYIEIRLFATKHRNVDSLSELINSVDIRTKSLLKKATHVTVKLAFTPLTYLTGFYDPANLE